MKRRILNFGIGFTTILAALSLLLTTVPATTSARGSVPPPAKGVETPAGSPIYFEQNDGQFDDRARFLARGTSAFDLYLTDTGAVYVLTEKETVGDANARREHRVPKSAVGVYVTMSGANSVVPTGVGEREHKTNYFRGKDEKTWQTNIAGFDELTAANVYDGIDLRWRGSAVGSIQSGFELSPDADPSQIEWLIEGADSIALADNADLLIETRIGTIRQPRPFLILKNADGLATFADASFVIPDDAAATGGTFRVGLELTKDAKTPVASQNLSTFPMSTYLGGTSDEDSYDVDLDAAGNIYITGETFSTGFPTTPGSFDPTANVVFDAFVTKLNPTATALVYSAYLGGNNNDAAEGIEVDESGNVFVTGRTASSDFPTTVGAFDTTKDLLNDCFLTKINASGNALVYSTLIGGNHDDLAYGLAINSSGEAFISGTTVAATYPTTPGAFDTTHDPGLNSDVFVTKMNAAGSALIYSTFLSSSGGDTGFSIVIDSIGNAYVAGYTATGFPTTPGAFDTSTTGDAIFVTKLNPNGSALVYSTLVEGNTNSEFAYGIAIDAGGNAYVTGHVRSATFPTTPGAFDTVIGGEDAFLLKLNPTGTGLVFSTFLGGTGSDTGQGVVIDSLGNIIVVGSTGANNFPTTVGAFDTTFNGTTDVFVSKFSPDGSALIDSTYVGGSLVDICYGITLDATDKAIIVGSTTSNNFPTTGLLDSTTAGAFDTTYNGGRDVFVSAVGITTTAAPVSLSGMVLTTNGNGVANATVEIREITGAARSVRTNQFGNFRFNDLTAGSSVTITAMSKGYRFTPRVITLFDSVSELEIVADGDLLRR